MPCIICCQGCLCTLAGVEVGVGWGEAQVGLGEAAREGAACNERGRGREMPWWETLDAVPNHASAKGEAS